MTRYNDDIDKTNAIEKEAQAIGDPEIVKDPDWASKRLEALNKKVTDAASKADDLRVKALTALGYSE
jgi:Holliday junction resolvasome RuvABC DNA-binding subunit